MKFFLIKVFFLILTLNVFGQIHHEISAIPADYSGSPDFSNCGPVPPFCQPGSFLDSAALGLGILEFSFNLINFSVDTTGHLGYFDFDCVDSITVYGGSTYPLEIRTGQTYGESIRIWIDYNNDGHFIPSEIVFEDSAILYNHIGTATIQLPPGVNIPLRMRVMSEIEGYPLPDGCSDVTAGHCYDYTGYITPLTKVEGISESGYTLYPNPAGEAFHISDPENQIRSVGSPGTELEFAL